ncbi:hypothetical protein CKA32_000437 [Geitlerinema sp. FC II]|nr:hypothetical protein CKA32_000437 [Geitlerinema sp. FC II]
MQRLRSDKFRFLRCTGWIERSRNLKAAKSKTQACLRSTEQLGYF